MSLLTKILLLFVIASLLALLGVGGRSPNGRIWFPGPRIPESLITMFWLGGSVASYAAAVWFLIKGARSSSRDDIGTAFGLAFIGAIMVGTWSHRRRTRA